MFGTWKHVLKSKLHLNIQKPTKVTTKDFKNPIEMV